MRSSQQNIAAPLVAILSFVPFLYFSNFWLPDFIDTQEADHSLNYMGHYIFSHFDTFAGLGIHTTGRWSILYWNFYWPDTYRLYVAGHALVVALPYVLLLRILVENGLRLWLFPPLALLLAFLLARSIDARFLVVAAVVLWTIPDFRSRRSGALFLVSITVLALTAHVKATFLMVAIVVGLGIAALEIMARRPPIHLLWLLAAFAGWAAVAGFGWADIRVYLDHGLNSNEGYSALFFKPESLAIALVTFVVTGVAALVVVALYIRRGLRGFVIMALWGVLLLVAFKAASVIPDGQHLYRLYILVATMALLALVASPAFARLPRARGIARHGTTAVVAGVLVVIAAVAGLPNLRDVTAGVLATKRDDVEQELRHFANFLDGESLPAMHEEAAARVRERNALPDIQEPVAVYGVTGYTVAIAHGLDFRALPILAAFEVWSEAGLRRNLSYLESSAAPTYLLFHLIYSPVAVYQAILRHYEPVSLHDRFLLLKRRTQPIKLVRQPVQQISADWDVPFDVPLAAADALTVVEYDFAYRPAGTLLSLLYRNIPVRLVMTAADGRTVRQEPLTRGLGSGGLVLSPQAVSPEQVANATAWGCRGADRGPEIRQLRLKPGLDEDWLFSGTVWRHLLADKPTIRIYSWAPEYGIRPCN